MQLVLPMILPSVMASSRGRGHVFAKGGSEYAIHSTGCAKVENCVNGSVNFGMKEIKITTKCCTPDLCNTQPAPGPSRSKPNGKQCYYCDEKSCTNIVNCEGTEDNCITATHTQGAISRTFKGCASKRLCTPTWDPSWAGEMASTCCEGNLCNGDGGGNGDGNGGGNGNGDNGGGDNGGGGGNGGGNGGGGNGGGGNGGGGNGGGGNGGGGNGGGGNGDGGNGGGGNGDGGNGGGGGGGNGGGGGGGNSASSHSIGLVLLAAPLLSLIVTSY
ncbi:trihydrophobin-like [Perca flavescens]|uniref:trihydrophobin-like n=1 Tax=Perca flavescens TaxID=8167 RepID=UPI00106E619B|nr:trihydrophobin-like [Perca flavescens]